MEGVGGDGGRSPGLKHVFFFLLRAKDFYSLGLGNIFYFEAESCNKLRILLGEQKVLKVLKRSTPLFERSPYKKKHTENKRHTRDS